MIRIGIDRQIFTMQEHGGISRYFTDLYEGLRKNQDTDVTLLFNRHKNAYLREYGFGKKLSKNRAEAYIKAMKVSRWGIQESDNIDIQHSTYYLGCPKKCKKALLVSTLYDMTPELMPEYFKGNPHENKIEWLKQSDLIISISDSAASDLTYIHPELAKKIRRIHLYTSFIDSSPQRKPLLNPDLLKRYFLFVGKRSGYKNAAFLLRTFAASRPEHHGHKLLFAGGGDLNMKEQEEINRLKMRNYVAHARVSDPELWYLYQNTSAVLVPSLAEGFSLPIVEALAADVPVICSDIPVHREIARDYARMLSPLQYEDWAEVLGKPEKIKKPSEVLSQELYRQRISYFSSDRMLQQHLNAYKMMLS